VLRPGGANSGEPARGAGWAGYLAERAETVAGRGRPLRDQRVGHAERTQVLGLLGNAYEAGVLPVGEYDARVVAVGVATRASQLRLQVSDLPPAYSWGAPAPAVVEAPAASGRVALILGIASVPLSVCGVGLVLGLLAVIAGRGGGPRAGGVRAGGMRLSAALIGRVFGLVGMALSIAALAAAFLAWHGHTSP